MESNLLYCFEFYFEFDVSPRFFKSTSLLEIEKVIILYKKYKCEIETIKILKVN